MNIFFSRISPMWIRGPNLVITVPADNVVPWVIGHQQAHILLKMTSSNRSFLRVNEPLCGEFTGNWWIPLTKGSKCGLWCFLLHVGPHKLLNKQSNDLWFDMTFMWRHRDDKYGKMRHVDPLRPGPLTWFIFNWKSNHILYKVWEFHPKICWAYVWVIDGGLKLIHVSWLYDHNRIKPNSRINVYIYLSGLRCTSSCPRVYWCYAIQCFQAFRKSAIKLYWITW